MITLTEAARDVLRSAVADHNTIRTPIITDRTTYIEIHQVLPRLAGGGHYDQRERAWDRLLPGGQLRAIVPPSLGYGRQRPIAAARAIIAASGGTFRPTPVGAFRSVGTDIHTLIVEATK